MRAWKPSEAGSQMGDQAKAAELASQQGHPGVVGSAYSSLGLVYPCTWIFLYPQGSTVSDISCFQVFVRSAWFVFKICSLCLGAKFYLKCHPEAGG